MENDNRGGILIVGKGGSVFDSIASQKFAFAFLLCFLAAAIVLLFLALVGYLQSGTSYLPPLVGLASLTVLLAFILNFFGFEIDAIFENGLTNKSTTLAQFLKGETFQPFEGVEAIGTGTMRIGRPAKDLEFLVLFDKTHGQILMPFVNFESRQVFYRKLTSVLRRKCPQARWTSLRWEDLSKK